ncbi:TonB-dependent receptor domain-containing protein [Chitinolyticbacter meiyuanensis]|uniref:TonB-dependent receptor domain-containing protein n=1 Tax=Chitinolyticbacter meiyuanensis TaxID=682798 RepID=UPI0011E5B19E|nr:TonB-dependent receptor [Chitinolyticbacter meiyuanensis]
MFPHALRPLPLALALIATTAGADTTLDPVIVTATRIESPRSSLSSDTTVLTSEDLARSGATSVGEALSRVGGVEFARTGGLGQPASLYLRGANGNHTLVLVDGQRLAPGADGASSFDTVPLALIDRIEIVRGSASGLYGADAVGGVVQIFTKTGNGAPAGSASIDIGSFDTVGGSASYGGAIGNTRFNVGADARNSHGYNLTKPASSMYEADKDAWRQRSANFSLAHDLTANNEIGIRGMTIDTDAAYDGGAFDDQPWSKREQTSLALFSNNRFTDSWQSDLLLGQGRDRYETTGNYPSKTKLKQTQAQWTNTLASAAGQWLLGLEYLEEKLASDTMYDQTRRDNKAALVGWQQDFGTHHLQANARIDDNSQFGDKTTGGIGYAWRFTPGWQLFANAGTSFHAPSFVDLYYPSWPGMPPAANPDLKPEQGRSIDGGLRWQGAGWTADATAFYNRVRDLIVLDANYTPQNVAEARMRGLTLNTAGRLGSLELAASATWQNAEDEATGTMLPRRAKTYGNMSLAQDIGDWRWSAALAASGKRYDRRDEVGEMGGYAVLDLGVDYRIAKAWRASLRLNNAFDRDYEYAANYNTAGRNWLLKLAYDAR